MKEKFTQVTSALLLLSIFAVPYFCPAQSGTLDTGFGNNGIVTTQIGTEGDFADAMVIQPDGKIVLAGSTTTNNVSVFCLTRYLSNGSLDSTFDADGIVTTTVSAFNNRAYAIGLQANGKLVVAGYANNNSQSDFALVRYHTDGRLDSTFNSTGTVITDLGTASDIARSLVIQPDGKIVVAGRTNNGTQMEFALVRYQANGTLDSTFNADGIATTAMGTALAGAVSVGLQADGKLVVAGSSDDGSEFDFALLRYKTDGSLDNTFDTDGKLTTVIGPDDDIANALAIQADGKIVVAGRSSNGSAGFAYALARYNPDGSPDNNFDADGKLTTVFSTALSEATAVLIQPDGKILAAGHADNVTTIEMAVLRYNSNGSLDSTFNGNGKVSTAVGTMEDIATAVALQTDGKIVVAGFSFDSPRNIFALARYNNTIVSGIGEIAQQLPPMLVYPNPLTTGAAFSTDKGFHAATLVVYNAMGEQVNLVTDQTGPAILFERESLPAGLYFARIIENNQTIASGSLIITD
jgi:uncharacterized delta-60 repeat protein